MERTSTRNGAVDLLRLFFTLAVVAAHYISSLSLSAAVAPYLRNGHIGVEFFFTLTGCLMAASADRAAQRAAPERPDIAGETARFMQRKFLTVAPVWYTVLLALAVTTAVENRLSLSAVIGRLQESVPSFLMLSGMGLGEKLSIPFSWYICVMMVALLILFPLVLADRRRFTAAAPLLLIAYCAFAMQLKGGLMLLREEWYGFC